MAYFVTGSTGFIGSNLVPLLLTRASRRSGAGAEIHLLVRESSRERLEALIDEWGGAAPRARSLIKPVVGDLLEPLLGVAPEALGRLRGRSFTHFFHLAALYDLTASEELNRLTNVEGTTNALTLAGELGARHFHHVSSIAVAGGYRGTFTEEMFDAGQSLEHAYQRTKFEAERLVRETSPVPWRIYRPAVVIGDSRTGRIDKVDGPYYLFPLLKRAHQLLPTWLPLLGPELGATNIVPVDYVVSALDHIAHRPSLDRRAFHLVQASPQRVVDVINIFAQVAEAPQLALTVDPGPLAALPRVAAQAAMSLPGARTARRSLFLELGIPEELLAFTGLTASFGTERTARALAGSGIEPPPLNSYADRIWHYWARHLDPDLTRHPDIDSAVTGKTVLITGASSGIGRATAVRLARSGATILLVARGAEQLEETRREIVSDGGLAHAYTADISRPDSVDELVAEVLAEHPQVDILVNNAGRSIRRSIELSYDRFHDFERTMQLNYLGTIRLIMGLLPGMRSRRSGHVINISSIGVQTNPPRFSAYVASKSALDAWTRVVSSECVADNVHFTTIHMPLVRTPMIAPTTMYDRFPTISPEQAAEMVAEAIRTKPKTVGTNLGTFGEVSYALFPKLVDQVLSTAYRVFPDSSAARGEREAPERASVAQTVFARLMRGVHW
jgi:NAD(P)-dependent dehydrogenase (short-subunit alcohol dehydrogenase family)/thioester reductase-like protein